MSTPDQPVAQATVDPAVHLDTPAGEGTIRRRRVLYAVTSTVLTVILGLAVLDAAGVADVYGVDSTWVSAEGGGYELRVRYGTVSRPGLATPLEIVVERPGGFSVPIELGIEQAYLGMWDLNGQFPAPSSETTQDEWLLWEFDPPEGDTFTFDYDARIEPAAQQGRDGKVAVFEDGAPVVQVAMSTRVLP